ncbi:uncharacterized protein [Centruroides vittatus]|uniref:uncharacterized protein isoform X2 n=1 Tax=Centruroides vittatus TaxID=120091 RepID=UPI00350F1E93
MNFNRILKLRQSDLSYLVTKRTFTFHQYNEFTGKGKKLFKLSLMDSTGMCKRNLQVCSVLAAKSKMFFFQSPFRWLSVRLDLFIFKTKWDPSFSLSEFIIGAKQAACTVINLTSQKNFDDLKGLIEQSAFHKVTDDIINQMKEKSVEKLILNPEDIQVAIPYEVKLSSIGENNYCDIETVFIAHKFDSMLDQSNEGVILVLDIKTKYLNARLYRHTRETFRLTP